jgi:hypothetical protein
MSSPPISPSEAPVLPSPSLVGVIAASIANGTHGLASRIVRQPTAALTNAVGAYVLKRTITDVGGFSAPDFFGEHPICPVCLEHLDGMEQVRIDGCRHPLCRPCLLAIDATTVNGSPRCPLCRASIVAYSVQAAGDNGWTPGPGLRTRPSPSAYGPVTRRIQRSNAGTFPYPPSGRPAPLEANAEPPSVLPSVPRTQGPRQQRDMVLRVGVTPLADGGKTLVTLATDGDPSAPFDVILLVDISASMGPHIARYKHVVKGVLGGLPDHARATVVTFSSDPRQLNPLQPLAPDSRRAIDGAVDDIEADGCTNLADALQFCHRVLQQAEDPSEDTALVLFTDGDASGSAQQANRALPALRREFPDVGVVLATAGAGISAETRHTIIVRGEGYFHDPLAEGSDPSTVGAEILSSVRRGNVQGTNLVLEYSPAEGGGELIAPPQFSCSFASGTGTCTLPQVRGGVTTNVLLSSRPTSVTVDGLRVEVEDQLPTAETADLVRRMEVGRRIDDILAPHSDVVPHDRAALVRALRSEIASAPSDSISPAARNELLQAAEDALLIVDAPAAASANLVNAAVSRTVSGINRSMTKSIQ